MSALEAVVAIACVVSVVLANLRWLRVAQREHYIPMSVTRFDIRWWWKLAPNAVLKAVAVVGLVLSGRHPATAIVVGAVVAAGPIGLSLRGRTSSLVWTRRLKTLAAIAVTIDVVAAAIMAPLMGVAFAAAFVAFFVPQFIDVALWIARPLEARNARTFVERAKKRLRSVAPTVVAITGSYGKTGTKQYVAHLLAGTKSVFATPKSFNNRAGLSRSINEQLAPGTDVFVAEMGTYGPGEIAELCDLCPPNISVFTAVGPVHLERFGTEENIVTAKAEIFDKAHVCVLNVDDERLAAVAGKLETDGKNVWRCGSLNVDAKVRVTIAGGRAEIWADGERLAEAAVPDAPPTNVACAIAVALELGVPGDEIASRLASLPVAQHRQEVAVTPDGLTVIDDTFNANPASVRRGLELLAKHAPGEHRRVVATPGMVELGKRQAEENRRFAADAAATATDLVVIGRTNRAALVEGAREAGLSVVIVDRLPEAVAWVRREVGSGDAVLYANDLPDHFP